MNIYDNFIVGQLLPKYIYFFFLTFLSKKILPIVKIYEYHLQNKIKR